MKRDGGWSTGNVFVDLMGLLQPPAAEYAAKMMFAVEVENVHCHISNKVELPGIILAMEAENTEVTHGSLKTTQKTAGGIGMR
jgi:hypothetical protein